MTSFEQLAEHPWSDGINAICWSRHLTGDFREVAHRLAPADGIAVIEPQSLESLRLTPAGRIAADHMLDDFRRLDALGLEPTLNCLRSYPHDDRGLPISTDVMSFHVDSAPVPTDTWLCTYWGESTERIENDDAQRLVDLPDIRFATALALGLEGDPTTALHEGNFDLHYRARTGARISTFGRTDLCKLAVAWPNCPVPPCIHRAPTTLPGHEPRLLLIC